MHGPKVEGITLVFPDRRTTVKELITFEPEDRSVGIFGYYIEVKDTEDKHWILNDGNNWIHPLVNEERYFPYSKEWLEGSEPDWNTIVGTYVGDLFPEPSILSITPRLILRVTNAVIEGVSSDEFISQCDENLDQAFGIGLDTELEVI